MIYSMSGFANTQAKILDYFWQIEIRSVNSRGLDIKIKAPDWIEELENSVRLWLKKSFCRGSVYADFKIIKNTQSPQELYLNKKSLIRWLDGIRFI